MKKNKFKLLVFALIIALAMVGCRPANRSLNDNRRLSTQTRINDSGWDTGTDTLDRDRMNLGQDNMIDDNNINSIPPSNIANDNLNSGVRNPNNNLDNGMTRPNDNLSTNNNNGINTLARKISDLPEVDEASVVINDDTAVVGVSLRGNTQNTMTNALRDKIENIVKSSHRDIRNVSITTEPDLFKRIRTMSNDMETGNPIKGFAEDIRDIIRSITPNTTTR